MPNKSRALRSVALILIPVIAGCGGGDSGGSATPAPAATTPSFTSANSVSVPENSAGTIFTASATDPQGTAVTITISGGTDAAQFDLDGAGNLSFVDPPNFDLPADASRDNVYVVSLTASSAGESVSQTVRVTVENQREGIAVTRILSGLTAPVAMTPALDGEQLMIAERSGRVLLVDGATGNSEDIAYVNQTFRSAQVLDMVFAFQGNEFNESLALLTHSRARGLELQVFSLAKEISRTFVFGDPWDEPARGTIFRTGTDEKVVIAIGDPAGTRTADENSAYGKMFEMRVVSPFERVTSGNSLDFSIDMIGRGFREPAGGSVFDEDTLIADRGGTARHELARFRPDWRPLEFGWPFWEAEIPQVDDPPEQVIGPKLSYPVDGEGGILAGFHHTGAISGISDHYVFADSNGSIWSVAGKMMRDNFLYDERFIENRTLDFAPDAGAIDRPVAIVGTPDRLYILDRDGELFRVEGG